jgi:phosphate-selective porin OprO/OprP
MNKLKLAAALLGSTALFVATPAFAQEPLPEAQQEPQDPDPSDTAADAAIAGTAPVDEEKAQIELLQAQVEALQETVEQMKAAMVQTTPAWKGAPQWQDEAGWSFKPRGRIQWDAGYVSNPDDAIVTRNLGFNTRARRIRLGAEGTIPGGFGYKCEMDFANSSVGFGDCIISYGPSGKPFNIALGNQESLNGLEQISSSRFVSFMERAAFDDAFINTRRIGANLGFVNKPGTFRFNAGLFAAHSIDSSLDNEGWIGAARAVYLPVLNGNQLHFGANFQHREFQSNNNGSSSSSSGAPSTNQLARYRARPFTQLTDVRFVDTGSFAARSDDIFGLEFAAIVKSLHFAAEGQYLKSNAYGAGDTLDFVDDTLNLFPGNTASVLVPNGNPGFWGGYLEAGYFFTGETRGYKAGTWDRTKVLQPFSKGGWGALQLTGRVDYLDLQSGKLHNGFTNNFASGAFTPSVNYTRGGKQLGFLLGLTWIPEDYVRFLVNYAHSEITGGPFADDVSGLSSSDPRVADFDYGVDVIMTRAQIDF